jgi:pSer/pThr/pTyr-binding forkhead associated (FHA) protein
VHLGGVGAPVELCHDRPTATDCGKERPLADAFDPSIFSGMSGLKAPRAPHRSTPEELGAFADADAQDKSMLIWRDGDGRQQILLLDDERRYSLGRRPSMSVSLPWDAKVSKLHAELECIDGEWVINDDGLSRNGTHINELCIHERGRLRHEDQIRIGHTILEFRARREDVEMLDTEPEDGQEALPALTRGEGEVLVALCRRWFADGERTPATNEEIARELHLSVHAVKANLKRCYAKCGYPKDFPGRRSTVLHHVIERGIVTPSDFR